MPQFYPFLNSEKERLKSLNLKLDGIDKNPLYSAAISNAAHDLTGHGKEPSDRDFAVIEFTLAKILLGIVGDPAANERYAEKKSDEYREALEKESVTFLIKIAREDFGMEVKTEESLRINFIDFLRCKPEFLKLSQMNLLSGYVQVTKSQMAWVLKGAIKNSILESIPKKKDFPDSLLKAAKVVKGKIAESRPKVERPKVSNLTESALPPCVRDIIKALEAGKANHNAHFVLVTFLNGLGLDEKSVLEVFKRSPKFKEKITSYQIKFAKDRGYTCPACESIKGYGLCTGDCPKNHPISNYFSGLRAAKGSQRPAAMGPQRPTTIIIEAKKD